MLQYLHERLSGPLAYFHTSTHRAHRGAARQTTTGSSHTHPRLGRGHRS